MRKFFEEFAMQRNMDPLVPETWYNISMKSIRETEVFKTQYASIKTDQGGNSVLWHCKGGLVKTLMDLFPDIGLERGKFQITSEYHTKETRKVLIL